MSIKLRYNKVYLVGINEERTSSHRVVTRTDEQKPEYVSFSGRFMLENGEDTYGTLVLDETMWKGFAGKQLVPGMETYEGAAAMLVKLPNIYYGCPLCSFRAKDKDVAEKHIQDHLDKWISQFEIEEVPAKRGRKCQDQDKDLLTE